MKFIHRLGFYLGGFAVGLIFLAFFLSGKRASCDYGPDARVLKNIGLKEHLYSENVLNDMKSFNLDSLSVANVLSNGDVNFKKSNTSLDSCKIYVIYGKAFEKNVSLTVENCESIARIFEIDINE